MTEPHRWRLVQRTYKLGDIVAKCKICKLDMDRKKVEARLNAIERLMMAWYECPEDSVPDVLQDVFVEIEHADILEGK